jgi:hypothetical protein
MALFTTDLTGELGQIKKVVGEIVEEHLNPLISNAIQDAGQQLTSTVEVASEQLQSNIDKISKEIESHRVITKDEIKDLIDYATKQIAATVNESLKVARRETSELVLEKIERLKSELQDAAVRSRKTLYFNVAISIVAALTMAAIGIVYRKIILDELDIFSLFRVFLLSAGTGTGLFALLKMIGSWRGLNPHKKNVTSVALGYIGMLRPNGAIGLFCLALILAACWVLLGLYEP